MTTSTPSRSSQEEALPEEDWKGDLRTAAAHLHKAARDAPCCPPSCFGGGKHAPECKAGRIRRLAWEVGELAR